MAPQADPQGGNRLRQHPEDQRVLAASARRRSWFSAAAPPTRLPGGSTWRSRSMVAPVAAVDGPVAGTTWSRAEPQSTGPRRDGGQTGLVGQHRQRPQFDGGRGSGPARPPVRRAEGPGDLVVAQRRVDCRRHDGDGGHVGAQAEHGQRGQEQPRGRPARRRADGAKAVVPACPGGRRGGWPLPSIGARSAGRVDTRTRTGQARPEGGSGWLPARRRRPG